MYQLQQWVDSFFDILEHRSIRSTDKEFEFFYNYLIMKFIDILEANICYVISNATKQPISYMTKWLILKVSLIVLVKCCHKQVLVQRRK